MGVRHQHEPPVVFGLAARNIKINRPAELNHYVIGTVRDDVSEQVLLEIVNRQNIRSVVNFHQNVKKLNSNRVDLIAYGQDSARGIFRQMGQDLHAYQVMYVMRSTPNCYAFSRGTDDRVVTRFQQALDKIKSTPVYAELLRKFGLNLDN